MGSGSPRGRHSDQDAIFGVLLLLGVVFGLAGYGWWNLSAAGRQAWLAPLGYGPPPVELLTQAEWLMNHRLRDLEGMAGAFLLAGFAGVVEGNARRAAAMLSGFGLRRLKAGRILILMWLGGTVGWFAAPLRLPYEVVAGVLTGLLFAATFTLARGVRRMH